MRNKILALSLGTLLLPVVLPLAAQEVAVSVALKIRHNGKSEPPPSQVTFEFDGRSEQLPVRNATLQLPPEVLAAKSVSISFKLQKEQLFISGLMLSKFAGGDWSVLLEDKSYGDDYKWAIRKRAKMHSSCIILFEPTDAEGTFVFVERCRTKIH
jgi:hypothetical protein